MGLKTTELSLGKNTLEVLAFIIFLAKVRRQGDFTERMCGYGSCTPPGAISECREEITFLRNAFADLLDVLPMGM